MMLAMGAHFRKFMVGALAMQLWSHPAMAAKEPVYLEPSSKWHVRYEDDGCRLIRTFGEDRDKVMVVMSRYGPGEKFRLTLAGNPVKLRRNNRDLHLQFGDHEAAQKVSYMPATMSEMPALVMGRMRIGAPTAVEQIAVDRRKPFEETVKLSKISASRYAAARYILVTHPYKGPIYLQTGPLEKPFAAFAACVDELITHWGIDVEKHKNLSKKVKPVGSPGRWVNARDYPLEMLRQRQQGIVQFRLSVDAYGKATQCHIQQSTRPQEFDDAVCKSLMKRAAFEPALDADGNPVASFWRNTVRFQLP